MSHVEKLTDVPEATFPEAWYLLAPESLFWFDWRFRVLERQIKASGMRRDHRHQVLEIGCGHGVLRRQLEDFTQWTVDGCDLHAAGLRRAVSRRGRTLLYDISTREPSLEQAYDALVMFDIIEHIDDPAGFLSAALFHLKPGGLVFVNVPAINSLFSDYDRAVGHVRRYSRTSLVNELSPQQLRPIDVRYWGFTMLPLLGLRYFQKTGDGDSSETIRRGITPPNAAMNSVLRALMHVETTLLPRPPLGTSVMAAFEYHGGGTA